MSAKESASSSSPNNSIDHTVYEPQEAKKT